MKISLTHSLLYFFSLSSFCLTSCDTHSAEAQSYESARLTVEETETLSPTDFLSSEGTYRQNLIDQWVLEGSVTSNATIANYKDVVLSVNYYSKTNTLLGTEQHIIYEYFTPGKKVDFKFKSFGYKGARSVGMEITSAISMH